MIGREPNCERCTHFRVPNSMDGPLVCRAFPEGIPDEIYRGGNPHTFPYRGDSGIVFSPIASEQNETVQEAKKSDLPEGGVWRTINGVPVYIKDGQALTGPLKGKAVGDTPAKQSSKGDKSTAKSSPVASPKSKTEGGFDAEEWEKVPAGPERGKKWKDIPVKQRDKMANAAKTIPERIEHHLKGLPNRPNSGKLKDDIRERVNQMKSRLAPPAVKAITSRMTDYLDTLVEAGIDSEDARQLVMLATDTLAAQEMESMTRQLGDHGVQHIGGNIDTANKVLDVLPQETDARDRAVMMTAQLFHDTGYLAPPSQHFLDEGHPRWSAEHFNENVAPMIEGMFGKRAVREIEHVLRTHDSTDIDWANDPVSSAVRVADNTSLFQKEKLPGLFRYAPENLRVLRQLANKEISLDDARKTMRDNVDKTDLPDHVKKLLHRAADEVSPFTPKFTLGMLGGFISGIYWKDGHLVIRLKPDAKMTELHKLGDFGQRQFAKFAEAYGIDPTVFQKNLNFQFVGRNGETVLEGEMSLQEALEVLESLRTAKD